MSIWFVRKKKEFDRWLKPLQMEKDWHKGL